MNLGIQVDTMTRRSFDIDIDVKTGTDKDAFGVRSYVYNEEKLKLIPHSSGYFLPSADLTGDDIPIDPVSGLSALDADEGEELGFFKVDLLTNTSYNMFGSKDEVLKAMDVSNFDWSVFQKKEVVEELPHINKHYSIIRQLQPQSVEDLADVLALIRPGKIDLFDDYLADKVKTRKRLYKRPSNGGMYFKKSHAIAYAMMIVVVINGQKRFDFFG